MTIMNHFPHDKSVRIYHETQLFECVLILDYITFEGKDYVSGRYIIFFLDISLQLLNLCIEVMLYAVCIIFTTYLYFFLVLKTYTAHCFLICDLLLNLLNLLFLNNYIYT